MAKNVNVKLTDEQYERYRRTKEWHGLTWPEFFECGYQSLDDPGEP